MLVLFNGGALPSGDEYCAVVVAAIKSNAGKSARSGNSATRGGRGDMRARNKIEFRKGGEGWLDASKKPCYCAISLCLSPFSFSLSL